MAKCTGFGYFNPGAPILGSISIGFMDIEVFHMAAPTNSLYPIHLRV